MAKIPGKFWAEESKEKAHKDIKGALKKAAGEKTKKAPKGKKKHKKGDCPTCGK